MRLAALGIAAIVITSMASSAQAESTNTTQFLLDACRAPEESQLGRFCEGYIMGVGEMMIFNGHEISRVASTDAAAKLYLAGFGLCSDPANGSPSGVAMVQTFTNWAVQHPEAWNQAARVSVAMALS